MKRLFTALALMIVMAGAASAAMPKAQVDTVTIPTKNLTTPMKVTVIQPAKAVEEGNTDRFPTVYVLNGYSGDYRNWPSKANKLDSLANVYNMIIVCPDGRDSWYWDSPVDPALKMETFFVEDLVPYIDFHFPTYPAASKRAITGLSMGGHGALYLAMRHPRVWGNAGSMSGGVDIMPFPKNWKMAQRLGPQSENMERWRQHSVMGQLDKLKPGMLNITFDCGTSDFFAEVNENLHKELLRLGIDHDYTSRPGNHSWPYWRNSILYHLQFFNTQFQKE